MSWQSHFIKLKRLFPRDYMCTTHNCSRSSQKMTVQRYNTKDHTIIIKKWTAVAQMVATNEFPEMEVADGAVGALWMWRWAKEGQIKLTVEERRKILFKSSLESWTEENKERALNLLAEYYDIFALEDGEMGCTEATEHKIKVKSISRKGWGTSLPACWMKWRIT